MSEKWNDREEEKAGNTHSAFKGSFGITASVLLHAASADTAI
jgi:hypothetical protein